jgi:hypothetical protein
MLILEWKARVRQVQNMLRVTYGSLLRSDSPVDVVAAV